MIKILKFIFIAFCLISCQNNQKNEVTKGDKYVVSNNLIHFFINYAWNDSIGTFYSEIDNEGKVVSDKIYTVASSRLIYGLAYVSKSNKDYLRKAIRTFQFQKNHLIGSNEHGNYSLSYANEPTPTSFDVWQQAYGLCGITELYRNSKNDEVISTINSLHKGFINKFRDPINKGFWGEFKEGKGVSGSKSLQSLLYPMTAYMINLWNADNLHKTNYEHQLAENIDLLYQHGWNEKTSWVNVKFNDDWTVQKTENGDCNFTVTPGHNFQLAALLLRAASLNFLSDENKAKYQSLGKHIIDVTLQKNIFHVGEIGNGFYSEVNPNTNKIIDTRKTWWQHAEAIIALSLYEEKYEKEQKDLEKFFYKTFTDRIVGGEYFYVTENNKPITTELKGSIGKSTYHTIEMLRFITKKQ
ncbi:AGE family epimerase/isomerase [Flammeovirga kamogawensis]|uniref:AGE family epimerase/isomerase n=1 Tax=Flammeovirga kamogawensis TaxID=373891 RepID=A0ABX8H2Y4_9BACT|nr:AGE family epimerase/isomerase [Flammeovirga kamogawensis]MBB6460256.1 mannose/cellobiose epimerase-like protein (N-acyl-D-glucosamine 2-epimerase family) [Flammeovirga kamogawensis]QWG10068.1 AGE family epimerase/isomerase [Flammeovirga kamogawensis]TRX65575.1 hypothetical protein EO216_23940 [Flammeovirga kamogawensis]